MSEVMLKTKLDLFLTLTLLISSYIYRNIGLNCGKYR